MFTYTNGNGLKYNLCKSYVIIRGGAKVPVYYFMRDDIKNLKRVSTMQMSYQTVIT